METKLMEGPKQFYEQDGKYYKIIKTRIVHSYITHEIFTYLIL